MRYCKCGEYKFINCKVCGKEAKQKGVYWQHSKSYSFDGTMYCNHCDESICDECGSQNLEYYDDGEGYPPNILCKDCEHWPQ